MPVAPEVAVEAAIDAPADGAGPDVDEGGGNPDGT